MEKSADLIPSTVVESGDPKVKDEKLTITAMSSDVEQGDVGDFKGNDMKGVDKAYAYASSEAIEIDEKTSRYLLRKIDTYILPWLLGLYVLTYLDKGV